MDDLFDSASETFKDPASLKPLAARMRPATLDEVMGQDHILAPGKLLRRMIQSDRITSIIFYGPPGCGKTSLAQVISKATQSYFISANAVTANVADIRKWIDEIRVRRQRNLQRTILFLDEIHRFNKAQQDVLMPHLEQGEFILVGATTHNPAFVLNAPLISRSTIFELKPIQNESLITLLKKALSDETQGFGYRKIQIDDDALTFIATHAAGDARRALNALEIAVLTTETDNQNVIKINLAVAEESCQRQMVHYDHDEDYHYDTISAFIKSIRGSDPDSAIYWLAKMLYAGEEPRFILRRLLILASEDIGNADPQALILSAAGLQACEFVGLPEAQIILSQLVTYLALAPKSNASYMAIQTATEDIKKGVILEVPAHLRDAHYPASEKLGHGKGYQYPHAEKDAENLENPRPSSQVYMPQQRRYYLPKKSGFEKALQERLPKHE